MPPVDSRYRKDIDGLRAVAIILVILFHAFPEIPSGGFVGVDVFFVISGYLISGILMNELRAGRFSLLGFYARRCRRIVPALAIVLVTVLVAGWILLLPPEYVEAGRGVLGGAAFVSNIMLWQQIGYFDATAAMKPLLHLWSLGIEEQFYVIWPLLLWVAYRWRVNLATMITVLLVVSFALMMQWPRTQAFYFLPSRFWELLLGGGLAYLERYLPGRMDALLSRLLFQRDQVDAESILPHVKGGLAVAMLMWSSVTLANDPTFPSWDALPPTLAAFLLISAGGRGWVNRVILASPPAVFIGRISFPLYLWHWPLLSFAHIVVGATPPLRTRVALVLLAVLLSWLTWRLVERPVQRWFPTSFLEGRRFGAVGLVAASVFVLIIAGSAGRAVIVHHGFGSRVADSTLAEASQDQFVAYVNRMKMWYNLCDPRPANWPTACSSNNPTRDSFAIYGDSHAEHYQPGLMGPQTASDGWLFLGRSGCPPISNVDVYQGDIDGHCDQNNEWIQAILAKRQDIKTVVLSSLGTPYFNDHEPSNYSRDGAFRLKSTAYKGTSADIYYHGLLDSISRLLAAGKRVILMIDTPELDFNLSRCVVGRRLQFLLTWAKRVECSITPEQYLKRSQEYREMASKIKQDHPDLLIYDPIDQFCDEQRCNVFHEGHSMYRDSDHLSVYGSEVAGASFLQWMAQQGVPVSKETHDYAASIR
ncbi:MAG: hypothetical protein QOF70_76 [Acetobacteraceae bacterium]|nr:hypothetical protein [Acetobacteraceae bacterium]